MKTQAQPVKISAEEEARRRDIVAEANWSVRMEGLGEQTADYNALSERWITGEISRAELETGRAALIAEGLRKHGQ